MTLIISFKSIVIKYNHPIWCSKDIIVAKYTKQQICQLKYLGNFIVFPLKASIAINQHVCFFKQANFIKVSVI